MAKTNTLHRNLTWIREIDALANGVSFQLRGFVVSILKFWYGKSNKIVQFDTMSEVPALSHLMVLVFIFQLISSQGGRIT